MEEQDEDEYYGCWGTTKRIWPIYAFITWLVLVYIITAGYDLHKANVHNNEVNKEMRRISGE